MSFAQFLFQIPSKTRTRNVRLKYYLCLFINNDCSVLYCNCEYVYVYLSLTGVSIDSSKSNDRLYLTSQRCDSVLQTESSNAARIRCVGGASYKAASHAVRLLHLTLYGHIKTAEQRTIIQQYGDCYTGR